MYENTGICTTCGGKCCNEMPGACFPSDFGLPGDLTKLNKALKSGKYTIDWWEGDPRSDKHEFNRGYFVRPAIKGKLGIRHDPSWGGVCCLLENNACILSPDERPLNCQKLEPVSNGSCITHDDCDKQKAAIAWIPYYEILK